MAMSTRFATCSACSLPQGVLVQEPPEHRPELDGLLDVAGVGKTARPRWGWLINSPYADGGLIDFKKTDRGRGRGFQLLIRRGGHKQQRATTPRAAGPTRTRTRKQQGGEPQQAIRRHFKAEAPATLLMSPSRGGEAGADMFQVDDLFQLDGFMDYSNMWKF